MKRDGKNNRKRQAALAVVLAVSLVGMILPGCAADGSSAEGQAAVEEGSTGSKQPGIDEGQAPSAEEQAAGEAGGDAGEGFTGGEQTPSAEGQAAGEAGGDAGEGPTGSEQPGTGGEQVESGNQAGRAAQDAQGLYEKFLSDEASAAVSSSYPSDEYRSPVVQKETSYTFTELGQRVSEFYLGRVPYKYAQYAYVEYPDGTSGRNLLVKFVGLDIYSPDDDSYAVFVISEDNGQLYITEEYNCWARSETTAYGNGILGDFGSGGAGDHYSGISAVLSDGTIASVYSAEELNGWWTSYVCDAVYSEVFGADKEPGGFIAVIYLIGDERYYQYYMAECTEEEKSLCEDYINRCRDEQGINWATEEEIQAAIQGRCDALGIDYGRVQQHEEAVWNDL